MRAVFKNGKHRTINISGFKFILAILAISLYAFRPGATDQRKQWVIVIDTGNGGRDPGSIGSFSKE